MPAETEQVVRVAFALRNLGPSVAAAGTPASTAELAQRERDSKALMDWLLAIDWGMPATNPVGGEAGEVGE